MARADESRVAGRATRGELTIPLEYANRRAGTGQLERAREADRPAADHDDIGRAHATVKSGSPSASTSTSTPSPGPAGAAPRPPAERGS